MRDPNYLPEAAIWWLWIVSELCNSGAAVIDRAFNFQSTTFNCSSKLKHKNQCFTHNSCQCQLSTSLQGCSQTITLAQAAEAGLLFMLIPNRKGIGDIGDTSSTPPFRSHSSEDSNTPENTQKYPFELQEGACTHRSHLSDALNKVACSEPLAHGANHQHQHPSVPKPHSTGEGCQLPCSLLLLPVTSLPMPQACWDPRSLAKAYARPWARLRGIFGLTGRVRTA